MNTFKIGDRVRVFDPSRFVDDVSTPLSVTKRQAKIAAVYEVRSDGANAKPWIWFDVQWEDDGQLSHRHFADAIEPLRLDTNLLLKAADRIEQHPDKFNLGHWVSSCGTVGCVAFHVCVAANKTVRPETVVDLLAESLLVVDTLLASNVLLEQQLIYKLFLGEFLGS